MVSTAPVVVAAAIVCGVGVGVGVPDRPARLLAARRNAPPELAGGWELPGGKVEMGETELEALHREIAEELGVRITVHSQVPGQWSLGGRHLLRVWLAVLAAGRPAPLQDHDQLRWVDLDRIDTVGWLVADRPAVRAATEHARTALPWSLPRTSGEMSVPACPQPPPPSGR